MQSIPQRLRISIHSPLAEADIWRSLIPLNNPYFNPQPPRGSWRYAAVYWSALSDISIHSPLAEADGHGCPSEAYHHDFNPQPLAEADEEREGYFHSWSVFQSTAPRRSWQQICLIFFFIQDIFYTNHTTLLIILQPMISKLFSFLKFFLKTKCESPMLFMCTWHSHQYSNLHYQVFIYQNYGSKSCSPYISSSIRSLLRLSTKNFYSMR